MDKAVLVIPGIGNSDAAHWQSRWQARHPDWQRLQVPDWKRVDCADWVAAIDRQLLSMGPETLVVAHSLGCLALAHWAAADTRQGRVRGALLVAVPDPQAQAFPTAATVGFSHTPVVPLDFPCQVVASSNDPYGELDYARDWAARRGAQLLEVGARGHLNSSSGLGDWDEGYRLLEQLAAG
ncbi:MAG: alpha/beta hydrolase [Candidatus Pseudomonas colombiensis]|nr:MAG: alpha/beta hydrolase [Pseudomonas sp.]